MFPVADVGAKVQAEDFGAVVEGVEVEVEGVDDVGAFVHDHDGGGVGVGGFATGVGRHAVEPGGVFGYAFSGGEPDVCAAEAVELIQVVEVEGGGRSGDGLVLDFGDGVGDLGANVGGHVFFFFGEPDHWCYTRFC